jgi:hypothetical protein
VKTMSCAKLTLCAYSVEYRARIPPLVRQAALQRGRGRRIIRPPCRHIVLSMRGSSEDFCFLRAVVHGSLGRRAFLRPQVAVLRAALRPVHPSTMSAAVITTQLCLGCVKRVGQLGSRWPDIE